MYDIKLGTTVVDEFAMGSKQKIYGYVINTKIGGRHVNVFDFVDKAHHIHNIFISINGC
jgi:hypothetical protein